MKPYGHKGSCWEANNLEVEDIQRYGYKTSAGGKSYLSPSEKARVRRKYKKKERNIRYESKENDYYC